MCDVNEDNDDDAGDGDDNDIALPNNDCDNNFFDALYSTGLGS